MTAAKVTVEDGTGDGWVFDELGADPTRHRSPQRRAGDRIAFLVLFVAALWFALWVLPQLGELAVSR